jgi:MFS family permease
MSPTFTSFRLHNYRLWFAGALVSNIGTWMQRVAQDWFVLTVLTADSGFAVGVVTALQFLPILLLSPYAGLVADRVPRRHLLIATQAAQGMLALGLGALALAGVAQLWMVYAFALALGVASAFDAPARQTFVAQLVPPEGLPNAVGLNSASFTGARLIGPGLAGLLIAGVGPGWVFIINGLSFAATIVALVAMRPGELLPMPRAEHTKGQVREGLAYVRGRPDILLVMLVLGVVSAFGLNFQLTSALMARQEFGLGPGAYGLLGSILAIGSLTGSLVAARRTTLRLRLILGAALGFGLAMAVQAVAPSYWAYALACVPVGFFALTMMTSANAMIQMSTEPVMRGRVMALYMMVFLGATPIGSPIVGWIGEQGGPRWAVAVGALASVTVAGAAAVWAARTLRVRVRYRLRPRPRLVLVPRREDDDGARPPWQAEVA